MSRQSGNPPCLLPLLPPRRGEGNLLPTIRGNEARIRPKTAKKALKPLFKLLPGKKRVKQRYFAHCQNGDAQNNDN
jgi:hypothetical protein